jgi:hypothetical protein
MPPNANTWEEWRLYVLKELERLGDSDRKQAEQLLEFWGEITTLKAKAGLWGAIGAAIPVCVFLAMEYLRNKGGP